MFDSGSRVGAIPIHVTEEAAALALDHLEEQERLLRVVEADRLAALLLAYRAAMTDLAARFGRDVASRQGLGAQTFFRTAGIALKPHPKQVAHLVDAGTTAQERLPRTWEAFAEGRTTWRSIDAAVRIAEGLDPDRWADYDEAAAVAVVSSTRLKDVLRRKRERLQDDTAAARARCTEERRAAYLDPGPDGSATFSMTGPAADLLAFDDALSRAAVAAHGVEGESRTAAQLRYDIALDLLAQGAAHAAEPDGLRVPQRRAVEVRLVLTVPALAWLGRTAEQAELEGIGPIDLETARRLAGDAKSFVRVLSDPVTGVRLTTDRTTYAPPADPKRWVALRDRSCRFPGCRRSSHLCDIDHAHEWQDGGGTDAVNLVSLCRADHLIKSEGLTREELQPDGTVRWRDPWGRLVDDPPPDHPDPVPPDLLRELVDDDRCPF